MLDQKLIILYNFDGRDLAIMAYLFQKDFKVKLNLLFVNNVTILQHCQPSHKRLYFQDERFRYLVFQ